MSDDALAPRKAAVDLTRGVLGRGQPLSLQTAARAGPLSTLSPSGRAWAQRSTRAVLRHLFRIDCLISRFAKRPSPEPARTILRHAVAEMRVLGSPPHAAVDSAVRLARGHRKARNHAGFVNAVGRRIAALAPEDWGDCPDSELPAELRMRLSDAWGPDTVTAIERVQGSDTPPLDLSLRNRDSALGWAAELGAELLPTGSLRCRDPGQVSKLPGYSGGDWWVQDAAAALPVRLLGDLRGKCALDLCAAPGGKTMQLAAAGATVTALDNSEPRLARVSENLARTGLRAKTIAADALDWTPPAPFEAILLDAPCSATGTMRRHPDLPHLFVGRDIAALVDLQFRMLRRAWDWLAPGGKLVFSTCSLLPEEGEEQVRRFLFDVPLARRLPADAEKMGVPSHWLTREGDLRTRPDYWAERGGLDGFFSACLEKPQAIA